ncbi:MAG TPA: glycosyltransferase family 2 protein [Pseudolysinimonas sp.]|jgi:GT2 family glycosyltransferase
MQPRVTAILVVRNGESWLDRTLRALAGQTRAPDQVILVDCSSSDQSAEALGAVASAVYVLAPNLSLGEAVAFGLGHAAPMPPSADTASEWLWVLSADTAPEPDALQLLLAAVEVAPSVVIAGPKVVDPDDRALIRSYGESLTQFGATVKLVEDELDQAQHDQDGDVLGVTAAGMLVQRAVWVRLGGFDSGLPTADSGLDFSIRARLAGFRVIRVAGARVSRGLRPEDLGRRRPLSSRGRIRIARTAQLHRRMAYAPGGALLIHWLSLVPLAVVRSIGQLLAKRPGAIGGEFAAAFRVAFDGSVPPARTSIRRTRSMGWAAIAPLRIPGDQVRELRAVARDRASGDRAEADLVRAPFFSGGGAAVTLVAAVVGVGLFWRLLGATAISGGALLPLDGHVGTLWSRVVWGIRGIGIGLVGPSDPFTVVVALLGSLTPWNPSFSLVLLWLTALPLAALGAWWCATRFTERRWPPVLAALLWTLAPPLLSALSAGRPAAVLLHLLLPWLVLATIEGARSWSASAAAALLFAAITACAPILAPALLLAVVAWAFARPRGFVRIIGIPLPAAALFAPLVVAQVLAGNPLGALADPGASVAFPDATGWQLLLGLPTSAADGWSALAVAIGLPGGLGTLAPALLLAPLAAIALLAIFLPGSRRAIPAMIVALLGLLTAVASVQLSLASAGSDLVTPWPGAGLSLYWIGLVGAAVVALDALGGARVVVGIAVLLTAGAAAAPLVVAPVLGTSQVVKSDGTLLPALVTAEGIAHPGIGTLLLDPQQDGSLAAVVDRGLGTTLDETSTLWSTRRSTDANTRALATLAGNLSSRSGFDPEPGLARFHIEFVLLPPAGGGATGVRQRIAESLDATPALTQVGETPVGTLWRVPGYSNTPAPQPAITPTALGILIAQAVVFGFVLLLAIPTARRRRVVTESALPGEDPADTFSEDDNA